MSESRLVKITTGHCLIIHRYRGLCHCTAGSSITRDATISHTCDACFHPLSSHQDYVDASQVERPSPHIINRLTTVSKLADLLDDVRVVQVTSPPSTGKTTLAHQLHAHYTTYGIPVIFLTGWASTTNKNPNHYLLDRCRAAGYEPPFRTMDNIVFIIDEAEASYGDTMLWGSGSEGKGFGLLRAYTGAYSGPKICLFTGYGTGHGITAEQRASLTPGPLGESLPEYDFGVFYSPEEFGGVLRCLCGRLGSEFTPDAGGCLYAITGGHPGAVTSLVNYVHEIYAESKTTQITKQHLITSLDNEQVLFEKLKPSPVHRSFPSPDLLTPPAIDFLWQVLDNRTVPLDLDNPGAKLCYEMGWVHTEATVDECEEERELSVVCFLPSRVHEKFIEYQLQSLDHKPFPSEYPTLTTLCEAIIRNFSSKTLSSNTAQTPKILTRPMATLLRDEWLRAFHAVVGHGVGVTSAWEHGGKDRFDFTIKDPSWGVQVLCDADDAEIEECCRLLTPGGERGGEIRNWIVLDCRHSVPERGCDVPGRLWRVVFQEDYSSVVVLDDKNEVVVREFALLGLQNNLQGHLLGDVWYLLQYLGLNMKNTDLTISVS